MNKREPIDFGKLRVVRERAKIWQRCAKVNGTSIEHEALWDVQVAETLSLVKPLADSVFFKHGRRGFTRPYVSARLLDYARVYALAQTQDTNHNSEEI